MAARDESSDEGAVDRSKPLERTAIMTRFQIQQRRAAACLQPAAPSSPIQTRQHPSSPPRLRPAPSVADQSTVRPPIYVDEQLHPMTSSSIWPPADGPDPSLPEPAARPFCTIDDRRPQPTDPAAWPNSPSQIRWQIQQPTVDSNSTWPPSSIFPKFQEKPIFILDPARSANDQCRWVETHLNTGYDLVARSTHGQRFWPAHSTPAAASIHPRDQRAPRPPADHAPQQPSDAHELANEIPHHDPGS
ncbi:hypothetical protein ACLOJK_004306 [Asimina triloba]